MKTDQLTALELMIAAADDIYTETVGAPTTRKRRKPRSNDEMMYASDFLSEAESKLFEDSYVVEVGSKTRRISTENGAPKSTKQRSKASVQGPVTGGFTDQAVSLALVKPSQTQLDRAFSEVFTDSRSDAIVEALEENTKFTKETAETLQKWLKWEKDQAYLESTKTKEADRTTKANNAEQQANDNQVAADGGGLGLPDRDNRRRRTPRNQRGRVPPKPSKWKARGRLGAIMALGLGAGYYLNQQSDAPETKQEEGSSLEKYDAGVSAGLAGTWALAAAKKVPFVGPAVIAGQGAWDTAKIATDDTLTEAEKEKAYTKTTVATTSTLVGTGIGTLIGGFVGSIIPVAGTAAGAAFGGMIGGILGDFFGNSIGDYVSSKIEDDTEEGKQKRLDALAEYRNYDENAPMFGPRTVAATGAFAGNAIAQRMGTTGGVDGYTGATRLAHPAIMKSDKDLVTSADKNRLGYVTAHFESGNLGVGVVSHGRGDAGGVSYGRHQLATETGTMQTFVKSAENAKYADRFRGLTPGTEAFNAVYKQIAAEDPEGFAAAQESFINRTHYEPLTEKLNANLGHDFKSRGRAVQEYLHTYANQFGAGGASSRLTNIFKGKNLEEMTDREILEAMGEYRLNNVDTYMASSSDAVKAGVKKRVEREIPVFLGIEEEERRAKGQIQEAAVSATEAVVKTPIELAAETAAAAIKEQQQQPAQAVQVESTQEVQMQPAPQEYYPQQQQQPEIIQTPAPARGEKAREVATARTAPAQAPYKMMTHTLDHIPVYIDDPVINMMKVGYV